ncbi:MAG: FMN-binding negative transcriptional regulator [Steroidobacteraceae bacterium]
MYLPQQFEETRLDVLHQLIRSHAFGTFVIPGDAELVANHMPFLVSPGGGPAGTLHAHVARSNPVWKQLGKPVEALVVFQGPESYITPSWYPSKHADGKAVPTWNYAVVHAYGHPRSIEDPAWLLEHVTQLTAQHESGQALPWQVSDAPQDYRDQMIARIVGIEIPISRIQGKWKVSQNRQLADRLGVAAGLQSRATEQSLAMAELVLQRARSSTP